MMDLPKKGLDSNPINELKKSCSGCNTTRTPLWRGGPAGPKSLCNACGIKYNKKRRAPLGLDRQLTNKAKKKKKNGSSKIKVRVMALGRELLWQRSEKNRSKLGEEEQAAIMLMALSCGSFYA